MHVRLHPSSVVDSQRVASSRLEILTSGRIMRAYNKSQFSHDQTICIRNMPGVPPSLFSAGTLAECLEAALEQRSELRADPDYGRLGPMFIFEVRIRRPDSKTLLRVLNVNAELADAIVSDREVVDTIED